MGTVSSASSHSPRARAGKDPVRRQKILEAAYEIFVIAGFGGASLDQIAQRAGVTKPTIYNYYDGKEELFRESIRAKAGKIHLATSSALNAIFRGQASKWSPSRHPYANEPRGILLAAGWQLMEFMRDEEITAFRRLVVSEAQLVASDAGEFSNLSGLVKNIVGHLCVGELATSFKAFTDAHTLVIEDHGRAAHDFIALITGELAALSLLGVTYPEARAREIVEAAVGTFLKAYRPE